MAKKYPYSEAFDLAPNAGITSDGAVKHMAENHASGIGDLGIGKKTNNAMITNWGDEPYAEKPESNGSMNYQQVLKKKQNHDVSKIKKTGLHYNMK